MKKFNLLQLATVACCVVALGSVHTTRAQSIAFINEDVLVNSNLTAGADGIPDNLGSIVTTTGRVTSIDFRSGFDPDNTDIFDPPFVEVYFQEAGTTEATRLFFPQSFEASFDSSTLTIGDEFIIDFAEIKHVHGVTSLEVTLPSFDLQNTGAGNAPIAPLDITMASLLANPEDYEGAYVLITNVVYSGNWPGRDSSVSLTISNATDNLTLRIDSDTNIDGQPAPTNSFDVQGIFTQFDTTEPFNGGYQILPNFYTDIIKPEPAASAPVLVLNPNTLISAAPGSTVEIDLFGIDTNAADTLTFAQIAGPNGSITPGADREATFSWTASGTGTNTFTFTVSDGSLTDTQSVDVAVLPQNLADIILNEFQADPAGSIAGDANGDGVRDTRQDEFVEIVNKSTTNDQDISSFVLFRGTNELYTFPAGTILTAETAVVVFGGGTAVGAFGGAQVLAPTNDWAGLSNGGANIALLSDTGNQIFNVIYGGAAGDNQALNRDPDLVGTVFTRHSEISAANGALFSPGTFLNGQPFPGSGLTNSPPVLEPISDFPVRIGQVSSTTVTASDIEGDTIFLSVTNKPTTAVFTDNGNGTGTLVYTGLVSDAGTTFPMTITADDGSGADTINVTLNVPSVQYSGLIVNEFLPDPDLAGTHLDSNNDGVENTTHDEFVELLNLTAAPLDLAGCTLSDANGVTHTFSALEIPASGVVVVFGGGSIANFTVAPAQLATSANLSLNNGGDTISLHDPATNLVDRVPYGDAIGPTAPAPDAASLNRNPDITGDVFAIHSTVPGSGGSASSPGTQVNGSVFLTNQPPTIVISGSPTIRVGETLQLTVTATEPDGESLTLISTNLPANASFVDTNGTGSASATFNFSPDGTQTGTVVATFIATDSNGSTTNMTTITVDPAGAANTWDFESGLQGWTLISEASNRDWQRIVNAGNGAPEGAGTDAYVEANGFSADVGSDDWLISPAIDLVGFTIPTLNYFGEIGFAGFPTNLTLNVSTDYTGAGSPTAATWDEISIPVPGSEGVWTPIATDLSAYAGASGVYVAFRYQSPAPGPDQYRWRLDEISLVDSLNSPPEISPAIGNQSVLIGETLVIDIVVTEADGDEVTLTATGVPSGAVFTPTNGTGGATGSFVWTPLASDVGVANVAFIATDVDGADTNSFSITVNEIPGGGECGLIFSEYIEGSSNNKALELYNGTSSEIDLGAGNYVIVRNNNGGTSSPAVRPLTGTIASGGTYIIANSQADAAITNLADQIDSAPNATFYNGDDVLELKVGGGSGTLIDSFGRLGEDGDAGGWANEGREHTLVRKASIRSGDMDSSDPYDATAEWIVLPQDTFSELGFHVSDDCPEIGDVDSDGDGISDADEAIAGTNPGDSNDFFQVSGIVDEFGDIDVFLPTKTNRNYVVQWTEDLSDTNSWQDLDPAAMGSGGEDGFTDATATNDYRFYRGDVRIP